MIVATVSSAAFSSFVDRYKAPQFHNNYETLTILNVTPLEAEVRFSFERDLKADTFLLDPPSMTLKPKEKQVGVGQVGRALVEVPRSCSSCSLDALLYFSLWGRG